MPKKQVDYSKTIFYKIVCKDLGIKNLYIGHTTHFVNRKCCHKLTCNNTNIKKYNNKLYSFIRENGNWDNWEMIQIEEISVKNKREAESIERDLIEKYNADLNSMLRPFITDEEKKLKHQLISKNFQIKHKEELKQKRFENKEKYQLYEKNRYKTPEQKEARREYNRLYYLKKKEEV